MILFAIRAR